MLMLVKDVQKFFSSLAVGLEATGASQKSLTNVKQFVEVLNPYADQDFEKLITALAVHDGRLTAKPMVATKVAKPPKEPKEPKPSVEVLTANLVRLNQQLTDCQPVNKVDIEKTVESLRQLTKPQLSKAADEIKVVYRKSDAKDAILTTISQRLHQLQQSHERAATLE
jgi:hypothetical protein